MDDAIFIPGQVPSSKRGKRIVRNKYTGRPLLISSDQTFNYKKNLKEFFHDKVNINKFKKMCEGKTSPITIEFTFVRIDKKRFDYGNLSQIVLDCMTGQAFHPVTRNKLVNQRNKELRQEMCWIEDDSMNYVKPAYGDFIVSKDNPGVYIRVL